MNKQAHILTIQCCLAATLMKIAGVLRRVNYPKVVQRMLKIN